jgi:hypothetical protein
MDTLDTLLQPIYAGVASDGWALSPILGVCPRTGAAKGGKRETGLDFPLLPGVKPTSAGPRLFTSEEQRSHVNSPGPLLETKPRPQHDMASLITF